MTAAQPLRPRLDSVDAMRGLTVAGMLLVNNPGDWGHVFAPLRHADWHGCTPTDLIFPFFLFVVGVSLALSVLERREKATAPPVAALLWRGARLFALGLAINFAAHLVFDTPDIRIPGVLQRIGLCVIVVGPVALYTSARVQWGIIAALLLVYWGLLVAGGSLAPELNLANRIDSALLGQFAYRFDPATGQGHDPEGVLSTLGAIATTLLGLRTGDHLRRGELRALLLLGLGCLGLGALWDAVLPFNKNLWTPSYVSWTGGWAALFLLALHVLVDRKRWPAWGRSFGVNAIVIYAGSMLLVCVLAGTGLLDPAYRILFANWLAPLFGEKVASLAFALSHVLLWWLVARALDRRRIYFKI